jgi:hypothetical protein
MKPGRTRIVLDGVQLPVVFRYRGTTYIPYSVGGGLVFSYLDAGAGWKLDHHKLKPGVGYDVEVLDPRSCEPPLDVRDALLGALA